MRILGIELIPEEGEDGRWAVVRFHGTEREQISVRLIIGEDLDPNDRVAIVDRAKAMLLEAAAIEFDDSPPADTGVDVERLRRAREIGQPVPSLEEEDDNAYQEPDEALPGEDEEGVLRRNPSREKPRT